MENRDAGAGDPMPEFDPSRLIGAFAGDVAAAAGRWDRAVPLVGVMSTDDEPWAVELYYPIESRPGLAVRTIRSSRGVDERGMPVEDLASVMVNFIINHVDVPPPHAPDGAEAHVSATIALSRGIRARASAIEPAQTVISIDGDEYTARRIDVLGCTAVEVPWADQTVFCVAGSEEIDEVQLRTLPLRETSGW